MCGGLGKFFKNALPLIGGLAGAEFLGPLAGPIFGLGAESAGATALGAGLGSFGGGLAGGEGLGDSLKTGALAGGGTFLGSELFGNGGLLAGGGSSGAGGGTGGLFSDAAKSVGINAPLGGAPGASAASAAAPVGSIGGFGGDVIAPLDESLNSFNQNIGNLTADLGGGGASTPAATGIDALKNNFVKGLESPSTLLSAAGLGVGALKQGELAKGERQLQAEAGQLSGQGQQLAGYLQSGTLPPGVQGGINQATHAAKAQIRSQYASRGMSGSSAEQADLARADQSAQTQGAEIAMQLLQQGVNESGLAAGLYKEILNGALEKDKSLGEAFTNFAQSFGGGGTAGAGKSIVTAG